MWKKGMTKDRNLKTIQGSKMEWDMLLGVRCTGKKEQSSACCPQLALSPHPYKLVGKICRSKTVTNLKPGK